LADDQHGLRVVIETGKQKVFASAIDWPGWSRPGKKTAAAAIEELLAYRERYNEVLSLGHLRHLPPAPSVSVVLEIEGDATTDFGVPGKVVEADFEPMEKTDLDHHHRILMATWTYFDKVASEVGPRMRKGPRGGGRDRDKIIDHVIQADRSYGRQIGVRTPPFDSFDVAAVQAHREAVFAAFPNLVDGEPGRPNGWPVRYAIRRMAWHILDHAWEMQDKDLGQEAER
jgi:hypothetical protein